MAPGHQIEVREGYTVNVARGRPPFNPNMVVCDKCKKRPSEVGHYCAQSYGDTPKLTPEQFNAMKAAGLPMIDCGEGYLHGYATCHGEHAEFIATFDQVWMAIDTKTKIHIFSDQLTIENKAGSPELTGEPEMKQLKVKE